MSVSAATSNRMSANDIRASAAVGRGPHRRPRRLKATDPSTTSVTNAAITRFLGVHTRMWALKRAYSTARANQHAATRIRKTTTEARRGRSNTARSRAFAAKANSAARITAAATLRGSTINDHHTWRRAGERLRQEGADGDRRVRGGQRRGRGFGAQNARDEKDARHCRSRTVEAEPDMILLTDRRRSTTENEMGQAIEALAHFVADTTWESIPKAVREHAKLVVLDTLGVILAG